MQRNARLEKHIIVPAPLSLITVVTIGALMDCYGKNPSVADKNSMPCLVGVGG